MRRRDLPTALLAYATASRGRSLNTPATAAPHAAGIAGESAARVTVADARYPPGCVDRYAINAIPGSTSMVAGFEAAIRLARVTGTHVTYGASAPYLLDAPIDCTFAGQDNQHGVVIRNVGDASAHLPSLLARHRGAAVFDCTGTACVELHDVVIGTDSIVYPRTGVLLARNRHGGNLFHKMLNCRIFGRFSIAPFYNYGAESELLINCYFANHATTPGTKVAVWTASNICGVQSAIPGIIATGSQSCIDHNCFGNQFYNAAGTDSSDCVYLELTDSWKNFGGWAYSASNDSNGRALIYVDMSRGASNFALVQGLTGEVSSSLQAYGILFSEHRFTPTGWKVDSCRLPNAVRALWAGPDTTLDNFHLANLSEQASHGLWAAGTVQNSVIHAGQMKLGIGRSRNNALTGNSENWSIATRSADAGLGHGDSRPWEPDLRCLNLSGLLDARARVAVHGSLVTISLVITPTRSWRCERGAAIGGLPFSAAEPSADVRVTHLATQSSLMGGYVEDDRVYLPAIDVGTDRIVITASYFAA